MAVRLKIKELAEEKKMKQKDIAAKSGVTLQLLNRYWHNYIQNVNLEQLGNIAEALGVEAKDLIETVHSKEEKGVA